MTTPCYRYEFAEVEDAAKRAFVRYLFRRKIHPSRNDWARFNEHYNACVFRTVSVCSLPLTRELCAQYWSDALVARFRYKLKYGPKDLRGDALMTLHRYQSIKNLFTT